MFGNFIYFIIAILIYTTCPTTEETYFTSFETLFLFFGFILLFIVLTYAQFNNLSKKIEKNPLYNPGSKFDALVSRQLVMAIVFFAANHYVLHIKSFTSRITLLKTIPTLEGLLVFGLFIFYLVVVWYFAYKTDKRFHRVDVTPQSYIYSNISFNIPILLPWVFISGITDIVQMLPFEEPKRFLSTPLGEVFYSFTFIFTLALVGPAIVQKVWRCKPLENGYFRLRIENLCKKADLEFNNILYWPLFGGRIITAGVMGIVKKTRYLLVTHAMLRFLSPEEIDAVIAHEIGHVKKNHLLFYLLFFGGYILLSYTTFDLIIFYILSSKPFYISISKLNINYDTASSITFTFFIILFFFGYFRYIFGYFMRNFERQADLMVFKFSNTAKPLISTFNKIASTISHEKDKPNWHHFSISERISYLAKCEIDKKWIERQNSKIKKSLALYITATILISSTAYYFGTTEVTMRFRENLFHMILIDEIKENPNNADLFSDIGSLYLRKNRYLKAINAYKKSLAINPDNPMVLNNLAWLYATCEKKNLQNPQKALELAKRAVQLERAHYILDTLAESFYVNGMYKNALDAGQDALDITTENHEYYKNQIEKFKKAVIE